MLGLLEAGCCNDRGTNRTTAETFKNGYLLDTHTAVAVKVYNDYVKKTGDKTQTIIASTANPYKFSAAVLKSIDSKDNSGADEFEQVELLIKESGVPCPPQLSSLRGKEPRFTECCSKEDMAKAVYTMLGI